MDGLVSRNVWTQAPHPKGTVVLGTKRFYTINVGERGEAIKPKCLFAYQECREIKGLHYTESSSLTAIAASIRMVLATGVLKDMEIRHLDLDKLT